MNHLRPHALATADVRSQRAMLSRRRRLRPRGAHRRNAPPGKRRRALQHSERRHLPVAPRAVSPARRCRWCRIRVTPAGVASASTRSARTCGCSAAPRPSRHRASGRADQRAGRRCTVREFALQVRDATRDRRGGTEQRRLRRRPQRRDLARRQRRAVAPRRRRRRPTIPTQGAWCASPTCATSSMVAAPSSAGRTRTTSRAHQIALDPERGRVLLGADRVADHAGAPFTATFHYGFARAIGGGEYERTPADVEAPAPQRTAEGAEVAATAARRDRGRRAAGCSSTTA